MDKAQAAEHRLERLVTVQDLHKRAAQLATEGWMPRGGIEEEGQLQVVFARPSSEEGASSTALRRCEEGGACTESLGPRRRGNAPLGSAGAAGG